MWICEFITAIIGVTRGDDPNATKAQISFVSMTPSLSNVPNLTADLHLHLLLCQYLGTRRLGLYRRDLPHPYSISRCRSQYRVELAVELHHHRHHPLHGRFRQGEPRIQSVLHLGISLCYLQHLRLLPCMGDQGSYSRASRSDDGRGRIPSKESWLVPALDLCRRHGARPRQQDCYRHRGKGHDCRARRSCRGQQDLSIRRGLSAQCRHRRTCGWQHSGLRIIPFCGYLQAR